MNGIEVVIYSGCVWKTVAFKNKNILASQVQSKFCGFTFSCVFSYDNVAAKHIKPAIQASSNIFEVDLN